MIIGNGLLANSFTHYRDYDDLIIFASGVSDSKCTSLNDFQREEKLLIKTIEENPNKKIIYFGTCSVYDKDLSKSEYVIHKLKMEGVVTNLHDNFLILRLPNIVGSGGNPNTVFNFLYNQIRTSKPFDLWENATRNFLSIEHLVKIVSSILSIEENRNKIYNIANTKAFKIPFVVGAMESFLNTKAVYNVIQKGCDVLIDTSETEDITREIIEIKEKNYIQYLLKKYYT